MEMTTILAALIAALAINAFIHTIFAVRGVAQRLNRLEAEVEDKSKENMSAKRNHVVKMLVLHGMSFIFLVSLSFGLLLILRVQFNVLQVITAFLLVITYSYATLSSLLKNQEIDNTLERNRRHP